MKKLLFLATLALLAVGCDDDSASNGGENTELIAPALYMNVVTGDGDKPFTGVLSIAPCTSMLIPPCVNRLITSGATWRSRTSAC